MRLASAFGLGGLLLSGCNLGEQEPAPQVVAEQVLPAALVSEVWSVQVAEDARRARYEQQPGWVQLVMERDLAGSLAAFSGSPPEPEGQARVHLEAAQAYRQAALVAARSMVQIYRENRRDEDPDAVDCLVGVSEVLLGEAENARGHLEKGCNAGGEELGRTGKAWLGWVKSGAPWPPAAALAQTPGAQGEPRVGVLPDAGTLPAYVFQDKLEHRDVPLANPGTLLALSLFHERAAEVAFPEGADAVAVLLDPWRLPAEPRRFPDGDFSGTIPASWLFGSALSVPADASFLAAATGSSGLAAVAAFRDRSVLATSLAPCVGGPEQVDVQCVLNRGEGLYQQLLAAYQVKSGQEAGFHKPFANLARVGVVRAGEVVARAAGNERAFGLCRLNAIDFSTGPAAEPAYLLAVTAWDAGNQNTMRATELLHAQVGRLPGVEVARYPLDSLQVRLGRESAPGLPMH